MTFGRSMHLLLSSALVLAFTVAVSGCAPGWPTRGRVATTPAHPREEARPSRAWIDPAELEERIRGLEDLLEGEHLPAEDQRREARALLDGYRRVLHALGSPGTRDHGQAAAILFDRLGSLETRYLETARRTPGQADQAASLLSGKLKRIQNAYLSGDYDAVVRACTELEDTFGADALTPETGLFFALALAETGKTTEAIRAGERILPQLEGRPGLVELRSRMVSWHLEAGNPRKARTHREKLVDDLMEGRRRMEQAEQAAGASAPAVRPAERPPGPTPSASEETAPPGPLGDLLHRVGALIRKKDYDQARLLLIRQRIRYPEGPEIEAIDRALERVDRAEGEDPVRPPTTVEGSPQEAAPGLEEARRHMEAEDFEGALEELDRKAEVDPETRAEVERLRERAESRIIQERREEAAKLFLMARNSQESEDKASRLRTSRRILKGLLERFPEASLAPKIRSNLETVEKEMRRIGASPEDGGRIE